MKLTAKGRYAVTAMMDLAQQTTVYHQGNDNCIDNFRVVLTDISERQNISLSYLEQLFASLRKANLVTAVRGPGGGYSLARSSENISIAEILTAVDENLDFTCGNGAACNGTHDPCLTHDLWSNLSNELYDFLDGKSLADTIQQPQAINTTSKNFSGIPIELS